MLVVAPSRAGAPLNAVEGMAELIPPLIDADAAKLPPMGGLTDGRLKLHSDLHLIDGRDRSQPRLSDQVARGRSAGLNYS